MNEIKITKDNVESTALYKEMRVADPNAHYFQCFLKYLVEVHEFDAMAIIDVMYYSHKYIPKYYHNFLVHYCLEIYGEPEELTY